MRKRLQLESAAQGAAEQSDDQRGRVHLSEEMYV